MCSARRVVLLSAFSKWALMTKAHIISKLGPAHRTAPQVSPRRFSAAVEPAPTAQASLRRLTRPDACACSLGKVKLVFGQVRLILQTLISLDSARANYYRYALGYSPYSCTHSGAQAEGVVRDCAHRAALLL